MAEAAAYASTAAAADHRRKKNALDKAKANYLCSQLRLRLQYAKLKVDFGWQRQSLNEVENLYFRHSQKRRLGAAASSSLLSMASTSSISSVPTTTTMSTQMSMDVSPTFPLSQTASSKANGATQNDQSTSSTKHTSKRNILAENTASTSEVAPTPTKISSDHTDGSKANPPPPMASLAPMPATSSHQNSPPSAYPPFDQAYTQPPPNPNPYAHYPPHVVQGHIPSTPAPQPAYSPHQYLAKAYVSSSPFPVNGPPVGSASPQGDGPTYDSFWSTHTSWGAQPPAAQGCGDTLAAAASGMLSSAPVPAPVVVGASKADP